MADAAPRSWPALDLEPHPSVALPPDFDDTLALLLDDLGALAVDSESAAARRVYFGTAAERDAAAAALAAALGGHVTVTSVDVPDEGWAAKVQHALTAVRVGNVIVAPPWDVPADRGTGRPRVIVIEPSTGFGTGHHQSTRLCLRLLQRTELGGRVVVDVGTGSGVLAIVAALAGASRVVAIDSDPDAAEAARANVERNGVLDRVEVRAIALGEAALDAADAVLANLTMLGLRRDRASLAGLVSADGLLIIGGFTRDQVSLVTEAFPEFAIHAREDEDDWVALCLRRVAVPGSQPRPVEICISSWYLVLRSWSVPGSWFSVR